MDPSKVVISSDKQFPTKAILYLSKDPVQTKTRHDRMLFMAMEILPFATHLSEHVANSLILSTYCAKEEDTQHECV